MAKTKNLANLKKDLESAKQDLQSLGQQQLMVQGVILYLNKQIQELEGGV